MNTATKPLNPPPLNEYEAQVYKYLNTLLPNDTINVADIVKEENNEKFIEIVKKYMRYHVDINSSPYMNGLSFSNDYTKIRKQWD
ncbi:hypothetical protein [Pseudotamlana carrageenivorans]|uniref:Uncharacterized protein n=1 Tax=Pseudotamlana carrageenivorans TaxID=2069432 RepID=A0A2I7SES0_9FLAO|nr:hypothetical protein [Tamlana carrageenivorans]AUS04402.1 hypothetical protein C1A40_02450 [Tamlana carrageenivorans]